MSRDRLRELRVRLWEYVDQPFEPALVSPRARLLVAIVIGVAATLFAHHQLTGRGLLASDFEYALRAAHRLLEGLDPYNDPAVGPHMPYPFDAQFPYPIFAAMLAVPFTGFASSYVAGAAFVGVISAVMAFAITRAGWWRLAIFLSPSYFVAASVANWPPLLVASAFIPLLFPLAIAKPSLQAPVMANYPNIRGFQLAAGMVLLSFLVLPNWPLLWLGSIAGQEAGKYGLPILAGPTILVLIALLWWRQRPARLLVMLAFVPQHTFFYDQLLLWLLPKTLLQSLALSAAGWLAYFSWTRYDPSFDPFLAQTDIFIPLAWTAPAFYLPALVLVMWQQLVARRREAKVGEPPPVVAGAGT